MVPQSVRAMDRNRKKTKRLEKIKLNLLCWAFMSLTVVFYAVFMGWPIICSIYYSLLNWSGMTSGAQFVGLENYRELLSDRSFWNAISNSFRFTFMVVPLKLVISLFLAYMLNNTKLKGRTVYRTIYFVPVITTTSVVGIIMVFICGVQGPVNALLTAMNFIGKPINFIGSGKTALSAVVLITAWKDCGTYMIYWLAGLQSVPNELYEAAVVDGASRSRIFFSIVLPLIAPTAGIITILCTINALKVFDLVKTLTDGGPFYTTDVIATYVYRMAFSSEMGLPRLGYASAASMFFGVIIIIIGIALNICKSALQKKQI